MLSGEVAYLNEHQVTVGRKSSELSAKMAEIEASTAAAGHKLQRVLHTNEMSAADKRHENSTQLAEVQALESRLQQVQRDMRVLYKDKVALHKQLQTARAETEDVESSQAQYRKMFEKNTETFA